MSVAVINAMPIISPHVSCVGSYSGPNGVEKTRAAEPISYISEGELKGIEKAAENI